MVELDVDYLKSAAEQGDVEAQFLLGYAYALGNGVPQNAREAVRWWRKAAENGHGGAQYNIGIAYFRGMNVPQDYAEAYFWLNLSASQNPSYVEDRDAVAANLSPGKIEEVQVRCKKWLEDSAQKNCW